VTQLEMICANPENGEGGANEGNLQGTRISWESEKTLNQPKSDIEVGGNFSEVASFPGSIKRVG